ncbi:MAG: phosphotransferase enzyme family protein [Oscillospiraceae bacterium]
MNIVRDVKHFISQFDGFEKISSGHINRTFKVYTQDGNYIMQYINGEVFSSVESIMSNISVVCDAFKRRGIPILEYLTTKDGNTYAITTDNEYIRMCRYIENSISLDFSNDLECICNAGVGFGQFCYNLSNVDSSKIANTIPNFHNTEYYLNRVLNYKDIPKNIDSILKDIYMLREFSKVTQSMNKRVTHNDTRFSNILLHKATKKPLCVIDLDTIMNGYVAYDFADGVRSICKGYDGLLDISKFRAFSKGFLTYPIDIEDKSILIDSIVSVSLELSSRYLYEYLIGGNYFNLPTIEENLTKAIINLDFSKDVMNKKYIMLKSE